MSVFLSFKVFMLENEMQQVNLDSERQLRVKDKKLMALKDIIKVNYSSDVKLMEPLYFQLHYNL